MLAAQGTGFTFMMTVLGAAMVFLFRKQINDGLMGIFFGFAAGVMTAACVWSLLIPAIEDAKEAGGIPWLPAAGGFCAGTVFLILLDALLPQLYPGFDRQDKSRLPCLCWRLPCITYRKEWRLGFPLPWPPDNRRERELCLRPLLLQWGSASRTSRKVRRCHCPFARPGCPREKRF